MVGSSNLKVMTTYIFCIIYSPIDATVTLDTN